VLAELNGYKLLIEAKDIEKSNIQVTKEGRITIWKYGRPYPFRTRPYFKAKERNHPNLAIIVTTATINFTEYEAVAIVNDAVIKVLNYNHFKSWIHSHTGRIGPGKLTDFLTQMQA
jgi:hypothetical protein